MVIDTPVNCFFQGIIGLAMVYFCGWLFHDLPANNGLLEAVDWRFPDDCLVNARGEVSTSLAPDEQARFPPGMLLSGARLLWRLGHPAPALPDTMPAWQRLAANASHQVLYLLFFAAPVTGWLFSSAAGFQTVYFGVVPIPDLLEKNKELADVLRIVHRTVTYALATLVVLHSAAAIKHQLVDRDDVLSRMLPFLKPGPDR